MQFDLLSDLHIESWPDAQQVQWSGLGTSLIAIIAGDVSRDLDLAYTTVLEISKNYKHVIYLDGNHEHDGLGNIDARRAEISNRFRKYRNITYMHRNPVVLDSTAFIGCNGWYSYDFCEPMISKQDCFDHFLQKGRNQDTMLEEWDAAVNDADFITGAIKQCNADDGIKDIVLITHTVPNRLLSWIPPEYDRIPDMGMQGSSYLEQVLLADTKKKVKVWCYGHLHQPQDKIIDGIRYVSNPRGIPVHPGSQQVYYPKFIKN